MRRPKAFLLLLFVVLLNRPAYGQAQQNSIDANENAVTGSLLELRNSRRVLLLIRRSVVIDSRGMAKTVLSEVYRTDADTRPRYPRLFNLLAGKLNDYLKRYQSISAVKNISDADFIIFFNLLEYRRPLGVPYPYGELFVIANDTRGGKSPHIVWKTRKGATWADDAIEDLIKDLKIARGEG
jgi:hypothetical protein